MQTSTALGRIKIFADGASLPALLELAQNPAFAGFTTNPTLMRKAGVKDYRAFAREALAHIVKKPISFEVFADDFAEMNRQARAIAAWGENVYVKIPITNTKGASAAPLIRELTTAGVKVNVTALCTLGQVHETAQALAGGAPSVISVFAGRIADTGRDPLPVIAAAVKILGEVPGAELIWASPRELLNVMQADSAGCHIITATTDILKKLVLIGRDLSDYSLDTVKMFYSDARAAAFEL